MNKFNKSLILSLSAMAMMVACKKDDKGESKAKTTEAPKVTDTKTGDKDVADVKKTPDAPKELMDATEALKGCWTASNAHDAAAFGKCVDDKSEMAVVDHTPPMGAKGSTEILAKMKMRWTAFSDIKAAPQLVLTNGQNIASILHVTGTNDGEMMGKPASNKAMSMFTAELVEMSPEGKIAKDRWWMDQGTAMHQMGMHENEMAPASETAWAEAVWVKAENNEAETANVAFVKGMEEHVAKADVDGYMALVADDVSFRYVGHKDPANGKAEYKKGFDMWMAMAEHKGTVAEIWGAGDWVVSVSDLVTTMKTDLPGTKDTKGKEVKSKVVEFYQVADGKLKTHWVFENTMNYGVQLGLMGDMEGMHGEHPGGEHPKGGDHPAGEHPKGEKAGGEHPAGKKAGGEHPKGEKAGGEHPAGKKADGEHPKKTK